MFRGLGAYLSVTTVSSTETAEPIEVALGVWIVKYMDYR